MRNLKKKKKKKKQKVCKIHALESNFLQASCLLLYGTKSAVKITEISWNHRTLIFQDKKSMEV